ncbi:hypothetical protein SAMN04489743_3701 [Pseudarthrobacter equi]|uniref:Uncharacterized protein n=1 Tax=Pseudarthrobacter equi TaxID=728066 RepID=A0A1H2BHN1_9MICC|nr:hypothetical protein [Pseudarthrobacter equi]SDT57751.1 hypothetical protein SAMN04489743_3701 [Pseudarthrobacter equi]
MGFDPNEPEQRRRLRAAMKAADIPLSELWLKYFSLSGDAGEYEVEAYLQGLLSLPSIQRDLLALAANELIDDLPRPRAPYSDDFSEEPGHTEPVIAEPAQDSGAATGQGPVEEGSGDDSGLAGGPDGLAETPEG